MKEDHQLNCSWQNIYYSNQIKIKKVTLFSPGNLITRDTGPKIKAAYW